MNKSFQRVLSLAGVTLLLMAGTGCTAKMKASYHLKRAERYYDAGKSAQAEIEYKNVLRNAPQNAEAWTRLGLIYIDQGRPLEAASILVRANQLDTNNLDVRLKLGFIYLGIGKFKEARAQADFVLEHKPQDDQAPILLAETAGNTNELAAIRKRIEAMRQQGDSAPLEVAWGILATRQKDLKTAEASFNRATALNPKFGEA